MSVLAVLGKGWVRSAHYWQALLALYLVNLIGGLLLALVPALELLGPAHYTAIREAASGIPAWMAVETLLNPAGNLAMAAGTDGRLLSSGLETAVLSLLLALGLLPLISWLPGCLVAGGLLLTYRASPEPFQWKRFFWGCWHYWGAFLLLGLIQTLLTLLVFVPVLVVLCIVMAFYPWSAILLAPALLLWLILWTGYFEIAQVCLVAGETRKPGRAFRVALSLLRLRFLSLIVYYGLSLLLLLLLHIFFRFGLFPHLPLAFWPLVFILQQAFIVLRIWAHASRLAGDLEFVRRSGRLGGKEVGEMVDEETRGQIDRESPFGEELQALQ